MSDIQQIVLISIFIYPFFWLHSFDPNLRTRVYLEGSNEQHMTFAAAPGWLSPSALFWTAGLGAAVYFNKEGCTFHPHEWQSREAMLALLTVIITGKIILGPSSSTFTSYLITSGGQVRRPVSYRLFDFVTAYPVNLTHSLVTKVITFTLFWILVWLLGRLGLQDNSTTLILPLYIVLAWALLAVGRLGQFFLNAERTERDVGQQLSMYEKIFGRAWAEAFEKKVMRKLRWPSWLKGWLFLVILISLALTYIFLEKALRDCGASPDSGLPSMGTVLAGLALLPVLEGFLVVFADAFTSAFHHH